MIKDKIKKYYTEFNAYRQFGCLLAFKLTVVASRMNYAKRVAYEMRIKYRFISNILKKITIAEAPNQGIKRTNTGPIWVCWWQGEDNMPPIVKVCWEKLCSINFDRKVILITKDNYKQFVNIELHIVNLFENGHISITQLSDILRFNLLYKYGGIWLDSTIYVNESASKLLDSPFITLSVDYSEKYISKGQWSSFLFGGNNENILFKFIVDSFNLYYKRYRQPMDYYIIDYIIAYAYEKNAGIRHLINSYAIRVSDLYVVHKALNQEFDKKITEVLKDTPFNKLTWKIDIDKLPFNSMYHHLIQNNL